MASPDLFIVMIDFGKSREAVVNPNDSWSDALALVREAMGGGNSVSYVRHIHDGVDEDRSEEAFNTVMTELVDNGEPLTSNQYEFIELHVSSQAAEAFGRAA